MFRAIFAGLVLLFSVSAVAQTVVKVYTSNLQAYCQSQHSPLRTVSPAGCSSAGSSATACFLNGEWFGGGICISQASEFGANFQYVSGVCPSGSSPSADKRSCVCAPPNVFNPVADTCGPPPPSCDDLAGSSWNGEACVCPAGTTQGYQCGVSTGCSNVCIDPTPPEGCPEGYLPFKVNGEDRCFNPNPPNTCPEGSYPIVYNGISQCWTPDAGGDQCPEGTYYVEIDEVGQCFNPEPNIEDPDSSSSSSSSTSTSTSSGGAGSSSSSGGGSGSNVDMSGVTSRLDQVKNKLDSTNSKLDDANETLTGIKDILEGEGGGAMPGHSQGQYGTFGDVNNAFYSRVENAPVVAAFSSAANVFTLSEGQCPDLEISLDAPLAFSASTTIHCDIFMMHAGLLSLIFQALWCFAAFQVFASA